MAGEETTWLIAGPKGLKWIGLCRSEDDAWRIALGWPDDEEIAEEKRRGYYAAKPTVTWTRPAKVDPPAMHRAPYIRHLPQANPGLYTEDELFHPNDD